MDFLSYREQLGIGLCDNKKYQHFLTILFNFLNGIPTDRSFSGISTKEYFVFPKGAVELDSALVSQPLTWLNQYDTYIM